MEFGPTLLASGAALFLFCVSFLPPPARLVEVILKPLEVLGRSSYEVYLIHVGCALLFSHFLVSLDPIAYTVVMAGGVGVVGWLINWKLTEPTNRALRRRFLSEELPETRRFEATNVVRLPQAAAE